MLSSSTISWKLREYRKSPTSTLGALPHSALAVLRPRRRSDSSTTSSCSRVEVWMNSMIAANWCCIGPPAPQARPASTTSIGRRRLPPAETMWSAIWLISTTSEDRRRRIRASTSAMSGAASIWIWGRPRAELGDSAMLMRTGLETCAKYRLRGHIRPVVGRGRGRRACRAWVCSARREACRQDSDGPMRRFPGRPRAPGAGRSGPAMLGLLPEIFFTALRAPWPRRPQTEAAHGPRHQQSHPRRQPRQRSRHQVHPGRHGHHPHQPGHHQRAQGPRRQPAGTHRVASRGVFRKAR
ncbi:hypothetical protein NB706_003627 [Xanthomonas sacchari]|nr:hypothetical protein [Xanthomonas sacchari]